MQLARGMVIAAALGRSASADGTAGELPESPPLAKEPLHERWEAGESHRRLTFDFLVEGSFAGWGVSRDGSGYTAMLRGGPGFLILGGERNVIMAYATYELSAQSQRTFGLHVGYIFEAILGAGLGVLVEPEGRFGGAVSVKVSPLLAIEAQLHDTREHGPSGALYLNIAIPARRVFLAIRGARRGRR